MRVAGVVLATATGTTGAGPTPLSLLGGMPLLAWTVSALRDGTNVDQIVVVAAFHGSSTGAVRQLLDTAVPGHGSLVLAGEPTWHGSLHRALSLLDSCIEIVVLHDPYRPLAPPEVVSRVVGAVRSGAPAAVPAVEVTETVKQVDPAGWIMRTVPRESLLRLQAPQAVRRSLLDAAHAGCTPSDLATGDTAPLIPPGTLVATVPGDHDAFPVLHAADLALAEAVLAGRHAAQSRTRS